jgi:hypothetical protein
MSTDGAEGMCPACGGAGGGPLGRAGRAWDTEDYVCPRCDGLGVIVLRDADALPISGPGVAKATPAASPALGPVALPLGQKRVIGKA